MDNDKVLAAAQVYAAKLKLAEDATAAHTLATQLADESYRAVELANMAANVAYQAVIDAIQGKERPKDNVIEVNFAPKLEGAK